MKEIRAFLTKADSRFFGFSDKSAIAGKGKTRTAGISGKRSPGGKNLPLSAEEKSRLTGSLTRREKETFLLLLEGFTLKETADRLGIGYSTANTYLTAVYRKLRVSSRAQLIIHYLNIETKKDGPA